MSDQTVHLFGIRHHGPGCARSLLKALEALQPDCLLVEGPPDGEAMLPLILHEQMQPPVAMLIYAPDESRRAVFYPFAHFSPEWQALRYGLERQIAVRFMDLPIAHQFALEQAQENAASDAAAEEAQEENETPETAAEDMPEEAQHFYSDPLDWLGRAAGYQDGESWWNHMVEERGDDLTLFEAIREAMTALRQDLPVVIRSDAEQHREALREAWMRKVIRQAQKEGFSRIAVVCGAWHVPALENFPPLKADNALLKGLPKMKVEATWTPWSNQALSRASGYGAGIHAPAWYAWLWQSQQPETRSIGWLARAAALFRETDIDCSSAHIIEATRLASALAAMRDRPQPGLEELCEALQTVVCMGESAPLALIRQKIIIGDDIGGIPDEAPAVPLQRDLQQLQKSLRLKPEASQKTLDLDLRKPNDLARSHLLHRLTLLSIPWGQRQKEGYSAKGTFHEIWALCWEPGMAMDVITASRWGNTVLEASTAKSLDIARQTTHLPELASLINTVLLADLSGAITPVARALESLAATTGDTAHLLETLTPLVAIVRYGNVRQTDSSMVREVLASLAPRAAIGLPAACSSLNDESAAAMKPRITEAHGTLALLEDESLLEEWYQALGRLTKGEAPHPLLQGVAARLLFDTQQHSLEQTATLMSRALSSAVPPASAAAWAEGFLNDSAMLLLHDDTLWQVLDDWLAGLTTEHFHTILPMMRRTFGQFTSPQRQQLGERASQQRSATASTTVAQAEWDVQRAARAVPLLRRILSLPPETTCKTQ